MMAAVADKDFFPKGLAGVSEGASLDLVITLLGIRF